MPVYDPDTLLAGHDSALVPALEARGVQLTPFEVLAIPHGTYTRSGLLRYAGTNRRFVDHLVRQIRAIQDGIPGPCRADVEALCSAGFSLSERELKAVAQGWGRDESILIGRRIRKHRAAAIVRVLSALNDEPC